MNVSDLVDHAVAARESITTGRVVVIRNGEILVDVEDGRSEPLACRFLQTSDRPALSLDPGDRVVVLVPRTERGPACVLGRIGSYREPDRRQVEFEAEEELVLRCGDSAIRMRKDGKLLARAVDIAHVARRRNRIKGGSVEIN